MIIDIPDMRNKMTRNEAISMLERMRFPEPWEPKITKNAEEALDMAINALSAIDNVKDVTDTSPCKTCFMDEAACCGCPRYYSWKSRKGR